MVGTGAWRAQGPADTAVELRELSGTCTGLLEHVPYRSGFGSLFFCHFFSSLLLSLLLFLKLVSLCPPKSRNVLRIALAVTDLRPGCPTTGWPIETVVLHLRPTEDVLVPSPHAQKF